MRAHRRRGSAGDKARGVALFLLLVVIGGGAGHVLRRLFDACAAALSS